MVRLQFVSPLVPLIFITLGTYTAVHACSRQFIQLTFRLPNCLPRLVLSRACRGTCTSYSRPSQEIPGQLERFCQCCDADVLNPTRYRVRCLDANRQAYRLMEVTVNTPTSCRCRPCSEIPEHIVPAEHELLQTGKRDWNFYLKSESNSTINDDAPSPPVLSLLDNNTRLHDLLYKNIKPFVTDYEQTNNITSNN